MFKKSFLAAVCLGPCLGGGQAWAAESPFADVPQDSWAFEAVAQLAKDGIVDGYPDGTFRGGRNITRFEMAQMVAKAMAHEDRANAEDKARIEKLSVEFANELQNLGVRVATLEEKTDNVKWTGMVRYHGGRTFYHGDGLDGSRGRNGTKYKESYVLFRFEPIAAVDAHWRVRARMDASVNTDDTPSNYNTYHLSRLWSEGRYGADTYKVGKMHTGNYELFDTTYSGVQFTHRFHRNNALALDMGRMRYSSTGSFFTNIGRVTRDNVINYQAIMYTGSAGKFSGDLSYHHMQNSNFKKVIGYGQSDVYSTYFGKGTYHFDKNLAVQAFYGQNTEADAYNKTATLLLGYKGFDDYWPVKPGHWGAHIAYRYTGQNAAPRPTYTIDSGVKGFEFSMQGTPWEHTFAWIKAAKGKTILGNHDYSEYSVRVEYHF